MTLGLDAQGGKLIDVDSLGFEIIIGEVESLIIWVRLPLV